MSSFCNVVIPCLNEEIALPSVINGLKAALPEVDIWVYDNGSTDRTKEIALALGAKVRAVPLRGKGHALIQAFADLDCDYLLLIDGDDTYDVSAAPKLLALAQEQSLDMVTGLRKAANEKQAYRLGHVLGNKLFTGLVRNFFSGQLPQDMLSGYRVFSRRFYKSFPFIISGFEIETYLTVHALNLAMPTGDIPIFYKQRPEGSVSKLHTCRDGFRVLWAIIKLILRERPFFVFSWLSFLIALTGLGLGCSLLPEYLRTHLVPRLPTAILASGLMLFSLMIAVCGVLLHYLAETRRGQARLVYSAYSAPFKKD